MPIIEIGNRKLEGRHHMRINWKRIAVAVGFVFLIYLLTVWFRDPRGVWQVLTPARWSGEGPAGSDVYILLILLGTAVLAAAWGGRSSK